MFLIRRNVRAICVAAHGLCPLRLTVSRSVFTITAQWVRFASSPELDLSLSRPFAPTQSI